MSVLEDLSALVALGAALVSALAALYARWQAKAAKRANEIALHESRLSVYNGLSRFRVHLTGNGPPCGRVVVASIDQPPGAAMKDGLGSIRTDLQGQGAGAVAAAGERGNRRGCARGWDRRRHRWIAAGRLEAAACGSGKALSASGWTVIGLIAQSPGFDQQGRHMLHGHVPDDPGIQRKVVVGDQIAQPRRPV